MLDAATRKKRVVYERWGLWTSFCKEVCPWSNCGSALSRAAQPCDGRTRRFAAQGKEGNSGNNDYTPRPDESATEKIRWVYGM
jgi:hypothetical protein